MALEATVAGNQGTLCCCGCRMDEAVRKRPVALKPDGWRVASGRIPLNGPGPDERFPLAVNDARIGDR